MATTTIRRPRIARAPLAVGAAVMAAYLLGAVSGYIVDTSARHAVVMSGREAARGALVVSGSAPDSIVKRLGPNAPGFALPPQGHDSATAPSAGPMFHDPGSRMGGLQA